MIGDLIPLGLAGPTGDQIEAARRAAPMNWWRCRYCGQGRVLIGKDVSAEAAQVTSHEKFCPDRPAAAKEA